MVRYLESARTATVHVNAVARPSERPVSVACVHLLRATTGRIHHQKQSASSYFLSGRFRLLLTWGI